MEIAELESAFAVTGSYRSIRGPAHDAPRPNKKLCLVATDKPLLVALLHEISRRPDCAFVKYSPEPRDGMFLGRVFLASEDELGRMWAELKKHPRLMCSLQDDDFILPYRAMA
jgi:hypothetical protein